MSAPVSLIECVSNIAYTRVLSCVMLALISSIIASIQLNHAIIDIQENFKRRRLNLSRLFSTTKSTFTRVKRLRWRRVSRLKARFGALKRSMDINLDDLPSVIYACFVLHNYCELNNEKISEEHVKTAIHYDREFQPAKETNNYRTDSNEGNRVRRIITKFLDP